MRTILCTVGTSIAQGCKALRSYQRTTTLWEDAADDLAVEIRDRLAGLNLTADAGRTEASAEINSLNRLGITENDLVVLLATDTADGRTCAEVLKRNLHEVFPLSDDHVILHRIPGLQVHDEKRLREEGLAALIDRIMAYVDNPQYRFGGEIILNPTGGYKGVVPFLAAIGMIFRLKTVYVFEFSGVLITLPPLPVSFDLHLYERAAPALQLIYEESFVHEEEFFARIPSYQPYERDLFLGFIEPAEHGMVTLSPLALALVGMTEKGAKQIDLSPSAQKALSQATGIQELALKRLLVKVSDPIWRSMHIHPVQGCDLEVYKPGNVAERVFCITGQDRVKVCELFSDHDVYERSIAKCRRSHYEQSTFTPWDPGADTTLIEKAYAEGLEAELQRLRQELSVQQAATGDKVGKARKESKQTEAKLRDMVGQLRDDVARREKAVKNMTRDLSVCRTQIATLQAEVDQLKGEDNKSPEDGLVEFDPPAAMPEQIRNPDSVGRISATPRA